MEEDVEEGEIVDDTEDDDVQMNNGHKDDNGIGNTTSKKNGRASKKQRKLIAEYKVSLTNDQRKRPGALLDAPNAKKLLIDPADTKKLSPEEFKALKKLLAERKRVLQQLPRFTLQAAGIASSLSANHDVREPIFMSDVQHLILYALGGNQLIGPPNRWCYLQKGNKLTHVLVLVVEGVSSSEFACYEHLFPKLTEHFKDRVEVMAPIYYGSGTAQELSTVPLSNAQKEAILKEYGSMEKAVSQKEIVKQFKALFPTKIVDAGGSAQLQNVVPNATSLSINDAFPRTCLLMGMGQMVFEGYPMPFSSHYAGSKCSGSSEYKLSKSEYVEVSSDSPMFAIDCEMCITETNPSELTRIAVVNENLKVVYESYVKPKEKIINYLTKFSGITEESLKDVKTTLEDVQQELSRLLPPNAIWIGQSLNCDLHALKIMHPYVIDTSIIFNLSGLPGKKSKLSHMAEVFLNEDIQNNPKGHCPIEDARAAMKLVKLKLSQGFLFGDSVASTDDLSVPESVLTTSIFNRTYKSKKTVAVVGSESVLEIYRQVTATPPEGTAFTPLPVSSNSDVVEKLAAVATSYQLTMAHVDVSKKLNRSAEKKEKTLQKIDSWCDKVYTNTSLNGMCVVIFSGPSSPLPPSQQQQTSSPEVTEDIDATDDKPTESIPNSNPPQRSKSEPRQNGVCFVRINTRKI